MKPWSANRTVTCEAPKRSLAFRCGPEKRRLKMSLHRGSESEESDSFQGDGATPSRYKTSTKRNDSPGHHIRPQFKTIDLCSPGLAIKATRDAMGNSWNRSKNGNRTELPVIGAENEKPQHPQPKRPDLGDRLQRLLNSPMAEEKVSKSRDIFNSSNSSVYRSFVTCSVRLKCADEFSSRPTRMGKRQEPTTSARIRLIPIVRQENVVLSPTQNVQHVHVIQIQVEERPKATTSVPPPVVHVIPIRLEDDDKDNIDAPEEWASSKNIPKTPPPLDDDENWVPPWRKKNRRRFHSPVSSSEHSPVSSSENSRFHSASENEDTPSYASSWYSVPQRSTSDASLSSLASSSHLSRSPSEGVAIHQRPPTPSSPSPNSSLTKSRLPFQIRRRQLILRYSLKDLRAC